MNFLPRPWFHLKVSENAYAVETERMGMDNPIPIIPITNIYFDTYPEKGKDLTKGSKDLAAFSALWI